MASALGIVLLVDCLYYLSFRSIDMCWLCVQLARIDCNVPVTRLLQESRILRYLAHILVYLPSELEVSVASADLQIIIADNKAQLGTNQFSKCL